MSMIKKEVDCVVKPHIYIVMYPSCTLAGSAAPKGSKESSRAASTWPIRLLEHMPGPPSYPGYLSLYRHMVPGCMVFRNKIFLPEC
jgi:hypothetical protein